MLVKFRNRFIILIMTFTSVILITSFAAIYITAYVRTKAENQQKLSRAEELIVTAEGQVTLDGTKTDAIMLNRISPDIGVYFNIVVNHNGELLVVDSAVELPYEVYEQAAAIAWNMDGGKTIELEGRKWIYLVAPAVTYLVIDDVAQVSNSFSESDETYQIRYLDVTDSERYLQTLMLTLLFIGPVMLVAFFFLSCYVANRAMKPMVEAWEKQHQFVADASHELKTPLSIVNANISALYANKEDSIESQLKWLDYIAAGTRRMSNLVNDLLSLAKLEDVNTKLNNSEVNVCEVLDEVEASLRPAAKLKGIQISKSILTDITTVTDPLLIGRVISILLDNAIKYSEPNGCVEISLNHKNAYLILSIQNSGKGIGKHDLPKVFDRFYRADASRNSNEGSYGLGLSIAKTIVEKLGGTIQAESAENEVTTFTVKIPLVK